MLSFHSVPVYFVAGRDMFVQFKSDSSSDHPGFHAHFDFETKNGTIVDTVSTLGEEFIPLDTDAKQHYVGEPGVGDRLYSGEFPSYNSLH